MKCISVTSTVHTLLPHDSVGLVSVLTILNCHFKLFGENYMKIITTGQTFLSNYE
jgi:hypothetical protein